MGVYFHPLQPIGPWSIFGAGPSYATFPYRVKVRACISGIESRQATVVAACRGRGRRAVPRGDLFPLLALLFGIAFHLQLVLLSDNPIFLYVLITSQNLSLFLELIEPNKGRMASAFTKPGSTRARLSCEYLRGTN